MPLNGAQRDALAAVFDTLKDSFLDTERECHHILAPFLEAVIRALANETQVPTLTTADSQQLHAHDQYVVDALRQLIQILSHPYPQNRSQGSPYCGQDDGHVNWFDAAHDKVIREPQGLLSLTNLENPPARHDPGRPGEAVYDSGDRVIRRDVIDFLKARPTIPDSELVSTIESLQGGHYYRVTSQGAPLAIVRCYYRVSVACLLLGARKVHLEACLGEMRATMLANAQEAKRREDQLQRDLQMASQMSHGELLQRVGKLERQLQDIEAQVMIHISVMNLV